MINKPLLVKVILLLLVLLTFLFWGPNFSSTNNSIDKIFYSVRGEITPDTNVVIIDISEEDLSAIGPWPLKRSYYALLINNLTKYEVKKIGIEIFLSSRVVTQTIYDNLLVKEINKAGNVVLSSVAGSLADNGSLFTTDSLSYPSPKLLNEKILTGHLNFIGKDELKIPLKINTGRETENAFALQLSDKNQFTETEIEVNTFSSWKSFRNFSLLEFFELVENDDPALSSLKNKTVIIGVTDPLIAVSVQTTFDETLPGVAFHAFAVDNLVNDRWINSTYHLMSTILLFVVLLSIVFLVRNSDNNKRLFSLIVYFTTGLVISFILFSFFYIKVNALFIVVSFSILMVYELIIFYIDKKDQLKGAVDESTLLKNLLAKKEDELKNIQFELERKSGEQSSLLVKKIEGLKSDIQKLRSADESEMEPVDLSSTEVHSFEGIVYTSKVMSKIVDITKKVAPEDATVLILGESGTGKELVARAIHSLSKRNREAFVAVNCGALSETLLESELFGHVKGAFTGAVNDKLGRFEAADKGTIFLDEIAETNENFQVKLLRVIQTGDFEKVGSSISSHADVRIIAATNVNIEQAVKENKFREDLFYRLNVIRINLPPLRERKEDILAIAQKILSTDYPGLKLSKSVSSAFQNYDWRGNVRELEAVIKHAAIFARSDSRKIIQLADLPKEIVKESRLLFEDVVIESLRVKKFSHSAVTETAKELGGIGRTVIAENFRGLVFKTLSETNYNQDLTAQLLAGTDEQEVVERVNSKMKLLISNIEKDLSAVSLKDFETAKGALNSKYKNLPQKFHFYIDEFIRWKLNNRV
ncbi:MAG: sigma 54-interacting transcriptional regulator [Ignavibacteriales bacterium]|nr:MAG: sigma 54-interacting transcriptional regulator [Ignavibacteriales bacterium]